MKFGQASELLPATVDHQGARHPVHKGVGGADSSGEGAVRDYGLSGAQSQWGWSPVRSAMAFECFRITGMKDPLQVHSFQMRSMLPSARPRVSGRMPASESSCRACQTMRQPDVDITHEPVRVGGAMRRYRLHVGTLPPSTGDVLMPPGEEARDGLALALQRLVDKAERVEVDTAVP